MAGELGTEQNIVDIKKKFLDHFADTLGYSDIAEIENLLDFQAGPKGSSKVVPSSSFMISR